MHKEPISDRILVTVTGRDRPGVTAALTRILAEGQAPLYDIEQVVVQGQLTLCLLISVPHSHDVLKELLFAAKQMGMDLDFLPVPSPSAEPEPLDAYLEQTYVVTAIAPVLGAEQIYAVASTLAREGANIEKISRLSEEPLASVEFHSRLARGRDPEALKRQLLAVAMKASFDVSLQQEGLYRRSKRLVVMDMDSTLIRIEVIDELAKAAGVGEEVARITERAMQGEMEYEESLRQRVLLLKGLRVEVLESLAANLPLTEGAETLVRVLKRLGYRIAVISGGFAHAADALKRRLALDYAFSNNLEIEDGRLTGRVIGPVVDAVRKAELLELIANLEGVLLDQVIAVGDGANDILMLQRAGLGIAFRGKTKLREAADSSLATSGLDAILYLIGISAREIGEIERKQ